MSLFISILVVLSTWFIFQVSFLWIRRRRRMKFTNAPKESIREVVDGLAMIVTSSSRHLNLSPNQPMHTLGRLVITEQWMVLASDKGILLRANRGSSVKVKELGKGRWMLFGVTPNGEGNLRIVLLPGEEDEWLRALLQFCG